MLTNVIFGGFALLTAVLAASAARVILTSQPTDRGRRTAAWKLFRAVWATGTVTATAGIIKLHQIGLLLPAEVSR